MIDEAICRERINHAAEIRHRDTIYVVVVMIETQPLQDARFSPDDRSPPVVLVSGACPIAVGLQGWKARCHEDRLVPALAAIYPVSSGSAIPGGGS